jgi:hypothetical protein
MLGKPFVSPSLAVIVNQQDKRAAMISDIAGAMGNGFKAEPDLSPCHLPLLSTEALERVHAESEKWRDGAARRKLEDRNTELELIIQRARDAFVCRNVTAHEMYQMLGAARDIDAGGEWMLWDSKYKPNGLLETDMVEIVTKFDMENSLPAGVVDWSMVKRYRRVK